MFMIEELRAQIDAVRDKLALAEQAGLSTRPTCTARVWPI